MNYTLISQFLGREYFTNAPDYDDHRIIKFATFIKMLIQPHCYGIKYLKSSEDLGRTETSIIGLTESKYINDWVPQGITYWGLGLNYDPNNINEPDLSCYERACEKSGTDNQCTFIFVTPLIWPGKEEWVKEKKKGNLWENILAYDATDLDEWMENSPSSILRLSNEKVFSLRGIRSIHSCWRDWASYRDKEIKELFSRVIIDAHNKLISYIRNPNNKPFYISTSNTSEALAFLNVLFTRGKLSTYRHNLIIIDRTGVFPNIAHKFSNDDEFSKYIILTHSHDVENERKLHYNSLRSIFVYLDYTNNLKPDIRLNFNEPCYKYLLNTTLASFDIGKDEISEIPSRLYLGYELGFEDI